MKKIVLLVALSLVSSLVTNAQKIKGNKNVTTEQREVGVFDAIAIQDKIEVVLTPSETGEVRVETDENLQEIVEVETDEAGILQVFLSQDISRKKALKVHIGVPESLRQISLDDKVKCTGEKELQMERLSIKAKGNAKLDIIIKTDSIEVNTQDRASLNLDIVSETAATFHISGKSTVKTHTNTAKVLADVQDYAALYLEGKTGEFVIQADGNTNIKAKNFEAEYADIKATGKPNIYINVSKEIIINSEDDTEIYLYNNPKIFIDTFSGKSTLYKK